MRTMPNIRAIRISDPVSQSSSSVSLLGGVIAPFVTFRITSRVIYDHNNHISDEKRITDPHDDGESSTGPGKGRKYTNDENYEILVVRRRFSDFDLLVKCFRASNYAEDASQLVIPPILPIATSPFRKNFKYYF